MAKTTASVSSLLFKPRHELFFLYFLDRICHINRCRGALRIYLPRFLVRQLLLSNNAFKLGRKLIDCYVYCPRTI